MSDTTPDQLQIPREYVIVFLSLLALLALTVAAAFIDWSSWTRLPGRWSIACAITIAFVKVVLIIAYFMHVRRAPARVVMFAAAGFIWLAFMIGLTMTDYADRHAEPAAVRMPPAMK